METREGRIRVGERTGDVSTLWCRPPGARAALAFAHGAGADMRHAFMDAACEALAEVGIATFRYRFPYMEQGSRRPSPRPVLLATVRAAVEAARTRANELPLLAGGKSVGGRMTSLAASTDALPGVRGLVFFGFPLHPAGRPGVERAEHLADVDVPLLFLQGTRDKLADLDRLRPVCAGLGSRATLHEVEGADHSFRVLKRSGRTDAEVLEELARKAAAFAEGLA